MIDTNMSILAQQRSLGADIQCLLHFFLVIFFVGNYLFAGPHLQARGTLVLADNRHMDDIAISINLDAKLIFKFATRGTKVVVLP